MATMTDLFRRYFSVDPLYSSPVKLFVSVVLSLPLFDNRPGHYLLFKSHVIREAEICGVIVAVEQTYNMTMYSIDDATGTLRCCKWKKQVDAPVLSRGTCVLVRGTIGDFRDVRQLTIVNIEIVQDPNREALHDMQAIRLFETVYSRQFVVPDDIAENADDIEKELAAHADRSLKLGLLDSQPEGVAMDSEYLRKEYLRYLKQEYSNEAFDYTVGMGHAPLVELAKRVLVEQALEPDTSSVNKLFAETMQTCLRQGDAVVSAEDKELYELVDNTALRQLVYEVIRSKQVPDIGYERVGGIKQEYIVCKVQEDVRYQHLPSRKTVQILDDMVRDSDLYMAMGREYKITLNHAPAP